MLIRFSERTYNHRRKTKMSFPQGGDGIFFIFPKSMHRKATDLCERKMTQTLWRKQKW